ncbi:aldose 1-epimerase [Actinomycetes bacterium]|nr:aldose 1-epimerase [Actinomycetes bacterium]
MLHTLDGGEISIAIDMDQGARIASLRWRELDFVVPFRGGILTWGWYAMAPWAGRIRDGLITDGNRKTHQLPTAFDPPNAIHGFGLTESWREIGEGRALLELPAPYLGATVEQKIEILDNAMRWSLEYEPGDCDLPAWLGFHPWFPRELERGGSAEIEFNAEKMFVKDKEGLPNGEFTEPGRGPWDDCFTEIRGTPSIVWEDVVQISIESDAPYWVVYNEDSDGVCVEPQTAPPDAANLGITGENYLEALFVFDEV